MVNGWLTKGQEEEEKTVAIFPLRPTFDRPPHSIWAPLPRPARKESSALQAVDAA